MNETRWRPDTCSCVYVYEWDPLLSVEQRVHTLKTVENVCSFHSGYGTNQLKYDNALENNRRKNYTDQTFRETLSSVLATTDSSGNLVWKNGITLNWSFSGTGDSRVLNVSVSGVILTTNQKNTLQNACNTKFGVGKVIVT